MIVYATLLCYWNMSGQIRTAVDRLNKYFGIRNMHVVVSQYWNQVHGFAPDDVRKDGEGLQTMQTLA